MSPCYFAGGCKVLLVGPWHTASNEYTCMFGDTPVKAELVQDGVLSCITPGRLLLMSCGSGTDVEFTLFVIRALTCLFDFMELLAHLKPSYFLVDGPSF